MTPTLRNSRTPNTLPEIYVGVKMIREDEVASILEEYLANRYDSYYKEVPLFSKKIDYVCINTRKNEITAIEVKVKNWREALRQAITYRICADSVYVALWHEYLHRAEANKEMFTKFGIGLLEVGESIRIVQKPESSNFIQRTPLQMIKSYITQINSKGDVNG